MANEIALKLPTDELVLFIQTLLSENTVLVVRQSFNSKLTINLKGVNKKRAQKEVCKWLEVRLEPSAAKRKTKEVMYGVGVDDGQQGIGFTDGPFPSLPEALQVFPEYETSKIYSLPEGKPLYYWEGRNATWREVKESDQTTNASRKG